jgi:glycyl-tRNA synthetase beta subunit
MTAEMFLMERYHNILENSNLPEKVKESLRNRNLSTIYEIDEAYSELIHHLKYIDYYDAIDRHERGTEMLAVEQDPVRKSKMKIRLSQLEKVIEELTPKTEG